MKITCEVIKDLLPSYVDELTSGDSNELIEEHLKTCTGCTEYLKQMRKVVDEPAIRTKNQKEIRPFRKLKRRIWAAVGTAVLVCTLLFGAGAWYYGQTWVAEETDVKMDIETQGGIATIRFTPKDDKHVLYVEAEEGEERTVVITEGRKNPFRKTYRQSAYYGLTFLDEHTVMGLNGESGTITEEDTLTIKYKNTTETVSLTELAEDSLENKPAKSDDVDMTYHKDSNGTVTLAFCPTMLGVSLQVEENGADRILIRQYYDAQGEPVDNGDSYSITFSDEHTLLLSDGTKRELAGDEVLKVEYQDKEVEIPLKDLWNNTMD